MVWLGVAAGVLAVVLLLVIAVRRRRSSSDNRPPDDVDPLFTAGIAIAGAGAALATTLGAFMYGVMVVGLIVMAVGAIRTRNRP
ncbi:MAG: hypothetical protein WBM50_10715 [Acidimicrobiales bacterium]